MNIFRFIVLHHLDEFEKFFVALNWVPACTIPLPFSIKWDVRLIISLLGDDWEKQDSE